MFENLLARVRELRRFLQVLPGPRQTGKMTLAARDRDILDRASDRLNAEALDVVEYQVLAIGVTLPTQVLPVPIRFTDALDGIGPGHLAGGFFEVWPDPPSPETHLRILAGSHAVVLAVDDEAGQVVGFITAVSDGVLAAYLPLLEVLPAWRGRGIGAELVRRMLARLDGLYMVDLLCEPELEAFYGPLGLQPAFGMLRRDYARQSGA